MATADCRAFTPELRSIAWPGKFKPDLPPRYDSTPDPAEFLQIYELSIEVANGDEKVMANWFPMENFQGTRDRPPTARKRSCAPGAAATRL